MKVGQLKQLLQPLDDDLEVLTPFNDHSFIQVCMAGVETVEFTDNDQYCQYYDDNNMDVNSTAREAFIISGD